MHIRFSTVVGLPVVEEHGNEPCAVISGILIHPDLGRIEGFFVRVPAFLRTEERFLQAADILHWGKRVRVRDADVLCAVEDIIRLEQLLEERRTVLGQRIISEGGAYVGMCKDVQFDTKQFMLEWIFPRRLFRWLRAIPVSSIVLVRPDAIVVRDTILLPDAPENAPILSGLETA